MCMGIDIELPFGANLSILYSACERSCIVGDATQDTSSCDVMNDWLANSKCNLFQQAAEVLERAGINPLNVLNQQWGSSMSDSRMERPRYCNLMLPPPQPLKAENTLCEQRLFIVCQPSGIPERVLRDAFCRFGGLIDVYLLPGNMNYYFDFGKS